jgi:hypothetical protein
MTAALKRELGHAAQPAPVGDSSPEPAVGAAPAAGQPPAAAGKLAVRELLAASAAASERAGATVAVAALAGYRSLFLEKADQKRG